MTTVYVPDWRTTVLDEGNCDDLGEDRVIEKPRLDESFTEDWFSIDLFCSVD